MSPQSHDGTGSPVPAPSDRPPQEEATHYGSGVPANGPGPAPAAPPADREATNYSARPTEPEATRYTPPPPPTDPEATNYSALPADPEATGYTPTPPPCSGRKDRRLPRRFGDYELLEEIARGGMGVVYKAHQLKADRIVALKTILWAHLAGPEAVERFVREARAAAGLDHPGIVSGYEVGEVEGEHFFSMALVEGGSLKQRLAQGPLPPKEAARLVRQVAEAVQYAHERGVVHRDIKPHNVLLAGAGAATVPDASSPSGPSAGTSTRPAAGSTSSSSGGSGSSSGGSGTATRGVVPKLTDFGLARTRESELSVTGEALGTPEYMPPEQARGDQKGVGPWSDIYSLGALLYALLVGRPPFQSASPVETMRQVLHEEPLPPRRLNPGVPADLETVCLKCLHKEPGRRYGSAREVAEELGRFEAGRPVLARPVGRLERTWRWCRRNPAVAGLLAAVFLVLLLGTAVSSYFAVEAARRATEADANAGWAQQEKEWADQKADAETRARQLAQQEKQRADINAARAQQAKEEADRKTKAEAEAREVAQKQLTRSEWLVYAGQIALAQREWQDNNVAHARDLLDACRWDYRGWEHRYLHTLFNSNQRTFQGHTDLVTSVAFSPDGKRLASASGDQTVKVWDLATGQETLTLKGHTGSVRSVSFSPDGKRLASASHDHTVKVWDLATGQETLTLKGHIGWVLSVSFSPDGKRLASASWDNTVKVWDVESKFTVDPAELRAEQAGRDRFWQQQQARQAEQDRQWSASAFHLRWLLQDAPTDANLHSRLGSVYAEQGKWSRAAAEFARAADLKPEDASLRYNAGLVLLALQPMRPVVIATSGVGLPAGPHTSGPLLLASALAAGTSAPDAYRQFCADLVRRFGSTRDAGTADETAFLAVLRPGAVTDPEAPVRLARRAVQAQPRSAAYLETLCAALYRAGHYPEARECLDRAVAQQGKGGSVWMQLFLAMTHYRLGHPAEARQWLDRAVEQIGKTNDAGWQNRLRWPLLRREAETLLKPARPSGGGPR